MAQRPLSLTGRQREVLRLVCDGHSNLEVAHRLGLTEGTVKDYVSDLIADFHVCTRTQLLRSALLAGHYSLPGYTLQPIPWQEMIR